MENPAPDTRPPDLSRAATPIAFIEAILAGYRRYGADPANALARAASAQPCSDTPKRG